MAVDLEELRTKWVEARPRYEEFATHVCQTLKETTRRRGIKCDVDYRCKDVASFLKKALRKTEYTDPWAEIRDKAGVRIITPYQSSVHEIEAVIRELFLEKHYENKAEQLEFDRLGYLGTHFEVSVRDDGPFADMVCEIQIHTNAQHLWSAMSHELAYKASFPIPPVVQRSIYRLVALMEIFDNEVTANRQVILSLPGHEEFAMLDQLERNFYPLVARHYDKELSLQVIHELKSLYTQDELRTFRTLISNFVRDRKNKLEGIYQRYSAEDHNFLLFQPEILLIFERAEHNGFRLLQRWQEFFPTDLLERLAAIWGIDL